MRTMILFLMAGLAGFAAGEDAKARIARIEESLIAPCCWQETVKTHRSEVALRMKAEIARMVSEGRSDGEIFDFFKQRYGQRVMVEPEGWTKRLAMLAPVVFAAFGLWFVAHFVRRWRRTAVRPAPAAGPAEALPEIEDE
jgi:cytochrome c-type biogenesis protein CcmH